MSTSSNMVLIETKTVGAGGVATLEFTSIPQTFTDLYFTFSLRSSQAFASYATLYYQFNGSTSGYSSRDLFVFGTNSPASGSYTTGTVGGVTYGRMGDGQYPMANITANTFGSMSMYIPNYTGSTNKSWSIDSSGESNSSSQEQALIAGLWSNTAAITSVKFADSGNFVEGSTISLYGIKSASKSGKATGGVITYSGGYYYHTFTASGTFTPSQSISADYLIVAGGGAGGTNHGGGGGAGGYRAFTGQSLSATGYTVTVGAGGTGNLTTPTSGSDSSFNSSTSTGGGVGCNGGGTNTGSGGSGGGGSYFQNGGAGNTPSTSPSQGNNGGNATGGLANDCGAGGGGASAAGAAFTTSGTGGNGGAGTAWVNGTSYAGGGGGGVRFTGTVGTGGTGGGGAGNTNGGTGVAGTVNTGGGGGGGGGSNGLGGAGGSGIVIIRYAA